MTFLDATLIILILGLVTLLAIVARRGTVNASSVSLPSIQELASHVRVLEDEISKCWESIQREVRKTAVRKTRGTVDDPAALLDPGVPPNPDDYLRNFKRRA